MKSLSSARATYSCIGDTVNLAARLEAHTKLAQRDVLLCGSTQAALAPGLLTEALGEVAIRGKARPVAHP